MPAPPPFCSLLADCASRAKPQTALEKHAEHHLAEERDDAGDHHRDHQHAHVAVADMGEFVAEHGLKLVVVERLEQAARHRDRILLLVQAGGEGIERLLSAILSLGIGMPREMQRFSSRL